ncbi:hypothetical protein MNBD_GAMMA18-1974 [hydrothermal vent metagenome]|uniref:Uncharacterized protein n=1 Tax=hydrothermal vent metagenome TaxID=652676 RepID=A0A3B0ZP33_9ZZZZ
MTLDRLPSLCLKSILNPLDFFFPRWGFDHNNIETAGVILLLWMPLQVVVSGLNDALLFFQGDTFQCAAIVAMAALANFDKNQVVTLTHDNVNFTLVAVKVLFN